MNTRLIARRSLLHYRRTNVAVVLGVACAVAVLSGALLVGDSVRASLRAIAEARLGRAGAILTAETFFREQLAADVNGAPLIILQGSVTHEPSGRRASRVSVYGVDDRFFAFHGLGDSLTSLRPRIEGLTAGFSEALARELGVAEGDSVLVRVARPSDIPLESLHGRRDESGRAMRATAAGAMSARSMGDFAVSSSQGAQLSVFLPLSRLQRELGVEQRVNAVLFGGPAGSSDRIQRGLRHVATPEDIGLRVRVLDNDIVAVESEAGLIPESLEREIVQAASKAGMRAQPVLTYLANEMRAGERKVPYSLVTAVDPEAIPDSPLRTGLLSPASNPIVLNDWAARDLGVKPGDPIEITYYRWLDAGRLATERATFTVAAVTPIEGLAADRRLAPDYPGISDTDSLSDWDPPFPVDLSLVRQIDEDYWDRYRTTPKAFIPIARGRELWQSRWGTATSLRFSGGEGTPDQRRGAIESALRETIDPLKHGLNVIDVRAESQDAAQ